MTCNEKGVFHCCASSALHLLLVMLQMLIDDAIQAYDPAGTQFAMASLLADGAKVLNVSTGLTRFSFPGFAAYAMAKGAVEVMTSYMARELGPRGIAVNTLAPGPIETDFGGGIVRDNPEMKAQMAEISAMGRTGLPDDIGAAVAGLLAPGTNWITGQRIEASGGTLL